MTGTPLGDGTITNKNTFQRLFSPAELRDLVEDVTGARVISPVPGIVYAFRRDDDRLAYLARHITPDQAWQQGTDIRSALAAVVNFLEQRGRMPELEETPSAILPLLGRITNRRLSNLANQEADSSRVEQARRNSILNVLLLLGIEAFNGRTPLQSLSLPIQADIRKLFASYDEANRRAERLLFKLRDDTYLRSVMQNSVGKMTPTAIYVHRRAADQMPILLKLYEHCGAIAAGRPEGWTLIKLSHKGRSISWLGYPDFDRDPHPRLLWSYNVDMRTRESSYRSYIDRRNRPLLHRKHEFLSSDDTAAAKYRRLTDQEIRAGLYAQPHLIGNESGWEAALTSANVHLRGHRLLRGAAVSQDQ